MRFRVLGAGRTLACLALAALATRFLIPSRMDGGERGASAALARLADDHPLAVTAALFLLFSSIVGYWTRRLGPGTAAAPEPVPRGRQRLTLALLIALPLGAVLARATVVEISRVVSPSMVPTLNVGDQLIVDRLAYGVRVPFTRTVVRPRRPKRGDVVVFRAPSAPPGATPESDVPAAQVKRVLALAGDVVRFDNGTPIVNGWAVPSCDAGPFVSTAGTTTIRGRLALEFLDGNAYLTVRTPLDDTRFGPFQVPPGELFVVGDDRSLSNDSRAWNQGRGGGVPIEDVTGRVSRLAVPAFRDGRLDLRGLLAPLRLEVREPNADLRKTRARIAACLRAPPASTSAPAPASKPAG